jgi:hypothetical protein
MDPIMRAALVFLDEAETFWQEHPGRVLPLVADASDRGEVVSALRLAELAPDNRRPLVVYEAAFADTGLYFIGLSAAVACGYEAVRRGVAEEGVELPAFTMNPIALGPLERAALAMERAAVLLGERFEGLTVALVPEQVTAEAAWRESVRALDRMTRPARIRVAAYAPPGASWPGMLREEGARFQLDAGTLLGFLREQAPSAGPASETAPEQAAAGLRALMLDAATKTADQDHAGAAASYAQARSLCVTVGLVMEEATVLMALGGACVAAGAPDQAIEHYTAAAGIAERAEAWALACQAWLGAGGACLVHGVTTSAETAYRTAARTARAGGIAVLEGEALRMAEACGGAAKLPAREAP